MTEYLQNTSTVQWRCRRGMLELDIFLIPFCEKVYPNLSIEQKNNFVSLLNENDVDLFEWLMNRSESENTQFNNLIKLIRAHRLGK